MMTRTTDTDDLRGGKVSVDACIALRVSLVAASASEVILAELIRRHIRDNMANDESGRAGGGGNVLATLPHIPQTSESPKAVEFAVHVFETLIEI
jgi:hypothetical protein